MFSEYASRFLAQSQSRLNFSQTDQSGSRNPLERQRGLPGRAPTRGHLQRRPAANNSNVTGSGRFPFASRLSTAPAPLFYSATDEFREEDDTTEERDREVADFFALQRSRRDFGQAPQSSYSSEEDVARRDFARDASHGSRNPQLATKTRENTRGIRSSWPGDEAEQREKDTSGETFDEPYDQAPQASIASNALSKSKNRLVDVNLNSTIEEADEFAEDPLDVRHERDDDNPPSLQQLRNGRRDTDQVLHSQFLTQTPESAPLMSNSTPTGPDSEEVPPTGHPSTTPQSHDSFWSALFAIDIITMFATFFLVVLHTNAPTRSSSLGDTIYTTMQRSFYLLAVDTVIAVVVALMWLAALRSFVRPLVLLILAAVPMIALSFSLYPFMSSYKSTRAESTIQDRAMRWLSFVPALFSVFWTYTVYKGRHSLDRAIDLLQFATRILTACPTLVMVGFATLGTVVLWTWVWMLMFTRIFLEGHTVIGSKQLFVIDTGTWWLGAYFILTYLWSLGVISGIQRATNAAATSQWYFYRNAVPSPSPTSVTRAAFAHASHKILGTICLSTLLSLAVRLPLLVLPGRISSYVSLLFYSLIPTSVATLTNPLTLTYAAIHSQPLTISARGLSELTFVAPTSATPTTALTPRAFSRTHPNNRGTPSLLAYRLAKLLLHATRFATALAFGFGGWVSTAKMLPVESSGGGGSVRGSLYAYIVGLVAGAIGWAVLGAMEGVLSGVLDAVVVCWGSEMQSHGFGQARFCREAGELLQDDGAVGL